VVIVALAFLRGAAFSDEAGAVRVNAEAQEKVAQLVQSVIEGDGKVGAGTNVVRNCADAEAAFREASGLMPGRMDLRFGMASSLICEAIQTNGQALELKVRDALRVYQEIGALDQAGFQAPCLSAAFARAIGDQSAFDRAIGDLKEIHPRRTQEYLQRFERADGILRMVPNQTPRAMMPNDPHHVIVVLGAGLEAGGAVKAKLVARLQQALKLARMYPRSPILLTGGNPRSGVTEAYAMRQWLARKRVSEKRLILEDRARDTVENALYSAKILQGLGATHATLVTSVSHVRRGLVDLQEACLQRGLMLEWATLAAAGGGDTRADPEQERVNVYRDLMRVSGLWDVPGIRR